MQHVRRTALAMAALLAGAACTAESLTWRVKKATAETWTTAEVYESRNVPYGLREVLAEDEQMVLSVRLELSCDWQKEYRTAVVKRDKIFFVTQDGTKHPLAGLVDTTHIVDTSWIDMKVGGKLQDDGKAPSPFIYRPLFVVPKTVTAGTLILGEREAKVATVPKPTKPLDPADAVKVTIKSAALINEVASMSDVRSYKKIPGALRNPFGKLLKVEFTLAQSGEEMISYGTRMLTVLTNEGVVAATCGTDFMDRVETTSHNIQNKNPSPGFCYFAVPASTKSFTLLFHNRPVTKPHNISR